ncbi:transglutaminase family protein [Paraglaciecola aquimarina]|uniref:Transglutaminase family protein n=1 Tax=Paraglaciecola algarum TaxID=3050085 RepID=A0ABS9DA87_9ALTE|nr:transglutaminase family protein [Paraglaciecola sp. G1-23]MCF2948923.1 transglutaminase family protein [Paraglaciecola sp. G1-23]
MKYQIKHVTTYQYSDKVTLSQNHARLIPQTNENQRCLNYRIEISPSADYTAEYNDYFSNQVTIFEVPTLHDEMVVTAISEVEITYRQPQALFLQQLTWESVRDQLRSPQNQQQILATEFSIPSLHTEYNDEIKNYALQSFTPDRAIVEACLDLMSRIFNEFQFDPNFTTISTPVADIFKHKRGVCQDFSHFALACIRSVGLAARYVSGYIETIPPEGQIKLAGADATHAWFSVYVPGTGWLEFDPTNNIQPSDQHVTLASGRDFADITPLKGVMFGGGSHQLKVEVDMNRIN